MSVLCCTVNKYLFFVLVSTAHARLLPLQHSILLLLLLLLLPNTHLEEHVLLCMYHAGLLGRRCFARFASIDTTIFVACSPHFSTPMAFSPFPYIRIHIYIYNPSCVTASGCNPTCCIYAAVKVWTRDFDWSWRVKYAFCNSLLSKMAGNEPCRRPALLSLPSHPPNTTPG